MTHADDGLVSHAPPGADDLASAVVAAEARIAAAGPEYGDPGALRRDLAGWQECDLGRWMLCTRGWDGYWTRYCIGYDRDPDEATNEVEHFFLTRSPAILATRERYGIFHGLLAEHVTTGSVALSVPCGLLEDLLSLPGAADADALIGVDLDRAALVAAADNAAAHGLTDQCTLAAADAWRLTDAEVVLGDVSVYSTAVGQRVDVLTSNGLNIYVGDDSRVLDLYRSFHAALRPGGVLIASALTPPTHWDLGDMTEADLTRARGLNLINDVMWANYRTPETTRDQLEAAGFTRVEKYPDSRGIFPTFVARARL